MDSEYRNLINAVDDDIEEEQISVFICPFCGLLLFDDSSYLPSHCVEVGDRNTMHEHIIESHLEDLKSDYGNED